MRRLCALLTAALLGFLWQTPARASSDMGCYQAWKLTHKQSGDCINMAFLRPENDTRVNLLLLLLDRHGNIPLTSGQRLEPQFDWRGMKETLFPREHQSHPLFADGEGSRCRSNAGGTEAFEAALRQARKVPAAERALLTETRRRIQPDCAGSSPASALAADAAAQVRSREGREFAAYLQGAAAFYDGDFSSSAAQFAQLERAKAHWLKETGRYMLGRVEVNRAQVGAFDEYGYWSGPERTDQNIVDAAETALLAYLRAYPRGSYARSARGLLRRVYWLGGRTEKLVGEYTAALTQAPDARGAGDSDIADEIDDKLLFDIGLSDTRDPLLLAVLLLKEMRACFDETATESCESPPTAGEIEARRADFARETELFTLLLAAQAFYVSGRPDEVLRLIPDADPGKGGYSYVAFSRQMLRRMALEALGRATAENWLAMEPGATRPWQHQAIELALALHYERSGSLAQVFEKSSPIRSPVLRETLIAFTAGPDLLRQQARNSDAPQHERELALFTLLYKELSRGAYRAFLDDLTLVPSDAPSEPELYWLLASDLRPPTGLFAGDKGSQGLPCPAVRQTARQLADRPTDVRARLCLAEFMRVNGFDDLTLDGRPPADELGGAPSLFPGTPYSRLEVYKAIIAAPAAAAEDKAYALYRAVRCYAPSGINSCGGEDVPVEQRRAWFQSLKREFRTSKWARELRYYW